MSANVWFIIAIVGFSLSAVAFIIALILFFRLKILDVIGDLSGRTVAREIRAMRDQNASSGDKRFRPSRVNMERGKLTEKVEGNKADKSAMAKAHASKRLDKTSGELGNKESAPKKTGTADLSDGVPVKSQDSDPKGTEVLQDDITATLSSTATEVLSDNSTEVLSDQNATAVLSSGATDILADNATEVLSTNETEVLSEGTTVLNGTTVLDETEKSDEKPQKIPVAFKITKSIIETHSDEVI